MEDFKIGETPLGVFPNIDVDIKDGFSASPDSEGYLNDVCEDALNVKLIYGHDYQLRTTTGEGTLISVDIGFPKGLVGWGPNGGPGVIEADFDVMCKKVGESTWWQVYSTGQVDGGERPVGVWSSGNLPAIRVRVRPSQDPVRIGIYWEMADYGGVGHYDIKIKRLTPEGWGPAPGGYKQYDHFSDGAYWTAARAAKHSSPIKMQYLALLYLRIKASDNLNGVIEDLSVIAHSYALDYKGGSLWETALTSNPASLYRYALQGRFNKKALSDSRLDMASIQDFHTWCVDKQFEFNAVISSKSTVKDIIKMICAAGRAAPTLIDNKWGVVIDRPKTFSVMPITPANSWGFTAEKRFVEIPHALRCSFSNRFIDWQVDERFTYRDGYDEFNATKFESIQYPGVTHPDHVWKLSRYYFGEATLRPETYITNMDIQQIVATRGDRVTANHDVTMWGLSYGIVRNVTLAGGILTVETDNTFIPLSGVSYRAKFWLSDGSELIRDVTFDGFDDEQNTMKWTWAEQPQAPEPGHIYMLGEVDYESVNLIVTGIETGPDLSAKLYLVDEAPEIHLADSGPVPAFQSKVTIPTEWTIPIIDFAVSDLSTIYRDGSGTWRSTISVSYHITSGAMVDVLYIDGIYKDTLWSNYITIGPYPTTQGGFNILDVEYGKTYEIKIRGIAKSGGAGPYCDPVYVLVQATSAPLIKPPDITNLVFMFDGLFAKLKWDPVSYFLPITYEIRAGSSWGSAGIIGETSVNEFLIQRAGTYWVAAKSIYDYSENPEDIVLTDDQFGYNFKIEVDEYANLMPGTKTDTIFVDGYLIIDGLNDIDSETDFDSITDIDWSEGMDNEGYYELDDPIDLTEPMKVVVSLYHTYFGFDITDLIDNWADFEEKEDLDGDTSAFCRVTPQIAIAQDDGTYSDWQSFHSGDYYGRYFKARLYLQSLGNNITPAVNSLVFSIDPPDKIIILDEVSITSGGYKILYLGNTGYQYHAVPEMAVDIIGGTATDYEIIELESHPATMVYGVKLLDSVGNNVGGTCNITIRGY
jgi:hypothetical protein